MKSITPRPPTPFENASLCHNGEKDCLYQHLHRPPKSIIYIFTVNSSDEMNSSPVNGIWCNRTNMARYVNKIIEVSCVRLGSSIRLSVVYNVV